MPIGDEIPGDAIPGGGDETSEASPSGAGSAIPYLSATKFLKYNAQKNKPAYIVKIENEINSVVQSTQADWAACSSNSFVDWTTELGEVTITDLVMAERVNFTTSDITELMSYHYYQSFSLGDGYQRKLTSIKLLLKSRLDYWAVCRVSLFAADKATQIGTSFDNRFKNNVFAEYTFNFSPQNIILDSDVIYWIKFEMVSAPPDTSYVYFGMTATPGACGAYQLDYYNIVTSTWTYAIGCANFVVETTGRLGHFYGAAGTITTKNFDLVTPLTSPGIWRTYEIWPIGTSISYKAWSSDTGAFSGEETYLGPISDGTVVNDFKRFYRVEVTMLPDAEKQKTPTLQSIEIRSNTFIKYSTSHNLGLEPSLISISDIGSQISDFDKTTVPQVTVNMGLTPSISSWLNSRYPKNKLIYIMAGFVADDFTEEDFIPHYYGIVRNWQISSDNTVTLTCQGYNALTDAMVPTKWQTVLDDIIYNAVHPCDVIKDIYYHWINIPDSMIDVTGLDDIKAVTPTLTVTRTITSQPISAKKLLEELRLLINALIIPQPDTGMISIIANNPGQAPVDVIDDDNTVSLDYDGNASSLVNEVMIYSGYRGTGDDAADFSNLTIYLQGDSIANWGQIVPLEIRDKWNCSQQLAADPILTRYKDPPPKITVTMDRSKISLKPSDMVLVTTKKAPSADMQGIRSVKYQIIQRTLSYSKDVITLKLLRA